MKANEQAALRELQEALHRRFAIVDVVLFGSRARGEESEESDLDVMIVVEESTPGLVSEIDDLVFEINLTHGCLISTIVFSRKELEEGPLGESPLYRVIRKEGIRL